MALIWLGIVASLLVWAAIVVMAGQSGISANFTCAAFSEVVAPASQLCYLACKRSSEWGARRERRRRHATSSACAGSYGFSPAAG